MSAREQNLLGAIFKKLEKATKGFTREGGIFFGTHSLFPSNRKNAIVQKVPKWFSGFTVNSEKCIQEKITVKYPEAKGRLIFYLMEGYFWYGFRN